ncbi:SIS domain-containing protein [Frankia sp. CH37]|nr:SIS domain-containing protein [Parafrankia sp. CH37]
MRDTPTTRISQQGLRRPQNPSRRRIHPCRTRPARRRRRGRRARNRPGQDPEQHRPSNYRSVRHGRPRQFRPGRSNPRPRRAATHTRCRHLLPLAQDAAYRFRTVGLTTEAPLDPHIQHVTARLLHPGTACLAISHTGQTQETLASAAAAKQAGAETIALTSFYRSPLAKIVETCLVAGSRETKFRIEAMSSRIIHSTILDALYVAVCLANPERAQTTQQLTAEVLAEHRI